MSDYLSKRKVILSSPDIEKQVEKKSNILVVYDSNYGNTKTVAEAIVKTLEANLKRADFVTLTDLENVDILIIGSPINGWRPTENIQNLLKKIKDIDFKNKRFATFDTRINALFHGDATEKMTKDLVKMGGSPIIEPAFFYVKGTEGPLAEGEFEKAKIWTEKIKYNLNNLKL